MPMFCRPCARSLSVSLRPDPARPGEKSRSIKGLLFFVRFLLSFGRIFGQNINFVAILDDGGVFRDFIIDDNSNAACRGQVARIEFRRQQDIGQRRLADLGQREIDDAAVRRRVVQTGRRAAKAQGIAPGGTVQLMPLKLTSIGSISCSQKPMTLPISGVVGGINEISSSA